MNLNPTAGQLLLTWHLDPLIWAAALAALVAYFWPFIRARRDPERRSLWPVWRAVSFAAGLLIALFALESQAASYTLNSMALYMLRLMLLAELAPPLLMLGLPGGLIRVGPHGGFFGRALAFLLDPWVTFALWTTIIVFWNLPIGFNASLVSATTATLLPLLYLAGGVLVWAVTLRALPSISRLTVGGRGWFGFLGGLPMMSVAAAWLWSPGVLYAPYVGVPCLWNLTPLQNQQISGWVMMVAGLPAMALAIVQLFAWLVELSEENGALEEEEVAAE